MVLAGELLLVAILASVDSMHPRKRREGGGVVVSSPRSCTFDSLIGATPILRVFFGIAPKSSEESAKPSSRVRFPPSPQNRIIRGFATHEPKAR